MRRILAYLNKIITDTCCDKDGSWNALRIMRNLCFGVGLVLAFYQPVPETRWTLLVLLGFGSQGMKIINSQYERKTADGNGNPLVQEGTAVAPTEPVVPVVEAGQKVAQATDIPEAD